MEKLTVCISCPPKLVNLIFCNIFTVATSNDQRTYLERNLPHHLNCVAALPRIVRQGTVLQKNLIVLLIFL